MSIINKLFAGTSKKLSVQLKQLDKLFSARKLDEAAQQLETLWAGSAEASAEDLKTLASYRQQLVDEYLRAGRTEEALGLAERLAQEYPECMGWLAEKLAGANLVDIRALRIAGTAVEDKQQDKRILLGLAKQILASKGDTLNPDEFDFLVTTANHFPLWKDGVGVLADLYLRENRRDAEALTIYRNAYPNRKADRRLRNVLLESLVVNNEKDDFAAAVYKDTVETGENPQALRLLAEYYIEHKEFTPATTGYILRALQLTQLNQEALKQLAELVQQTTGSFFDRTEISLAIFRRGFASREMLAFLGEALAEANRFDKESIEIMTRAFEQRVVSKRAILILAEHCLANEREDEFAIHVYETYLSTWPDRPQRRIYSILAHQYAAQTRVDDQAQKIYEEARRDAPTDTIVLLILARAYHAADRRDEAADEVYRHAFPLAEDEIKIQLARILAEMRVEANAFTEETLQYLTVMGRPTGGPLVARYDEALTSCFLSTGRRGEQAQQAYIDLFQRTEHSPEINPRLVEMLAELIKERGTPPPTDSLEMRVYRKLFEMQKFSTEPEISFILLEDAIQHSPHDLNLTYVAVRCFEADQDRLIALVSQYTREQLVQDIGDFYIEHYNFPLASRAYQASFALNPTDQIRYRLAKIQLLDGEAEAALEHLHQLNQPEFADKRLYWEAAAYQMLGDIDRAEVLLSKLPADGPIPAFLLRLRRAINSELRGQLELALQDYQDLSGQKQYSLFDRWLQLQRGIVLMKLGQLAEAHAHLEEAHRRNPNSRAEQLFLSLAKFLMAHEALRKNDLNRALPQFTSAVEVNRNDRMLRQVIVELLCLYGEQAFFQNHLERSSRILEVANRILPKRPETKVYLAYTYHRMKDFGKALIYYRDITWTDENPRLERSQAYAYISHNQPDKAWRVFLDLARRKNLEREDFVRAVGCFLADKEAMGGRAWEPVEFPEGVDAIQQTALMLHDGLFERAISILNKLLKADAGNLQLRWYLGRAHAMLDQRDLAVHNWKELLRLCAAADAASEVKQRQYTEIGLAFLEAGYAQEAMQTWEKLRELDPDNRDLALLYAATLNLNAYQLARKDQLKLAREEWKKALQFDPEFPPLVQNCAIVNLLLDDYDTATKEFQRLASLWSSMAMQNRRDYGHLAPLVASLERAMNTLSLIKGRAEHDITKAKAEMAIDDFQKANQFYWILGLDKRATQAQIENEYFRLIKIFNPERHADDFMLVEESYTYLIRNPERRPLIDIFVFNPIDTELQRKRLNRVAADGRISFEQLLLPDTVPPPDYLQLTPPKSDEDKLAAPLKDLLSINFKIADWTMV